MKYESISNREKLREFGTDKWGRNNRSTLLTVWALYIALAVILHVNSWAVSNLITFLASLPVISFLFGGIRNDMGWHTGVSVLAFPEVIRLLLNSASSTNFEIEDVRGRSKGHLDQ